MKITGYEVYGLVYAKDQNKTSSDISESSKENIKPSPFNDQNFLKAFIVSQVPGAVSFTETAVSDTCHKGTIESQKRKAGEMSLSENQAVKKQGFSR